MTGLKHFLPLTLILLLPGCKGLLDGSEYVKSEWDDFTNNISGFEISAQNVIGRSLYSQSASWTDYVFFEVNEVELSNNGFLAICANKAPVNNAILSEVRLITHGLKDWEAVESSFQLQSGCHDASGDLLADRESERKIRILTPDAFIIVAYTI